MYIYIRSIYRYRAIEIYRYIYEVYYISIYLLNPVKKAILEPKSYFTY